MFQEWKCEIIDNKGYLYNIPNDTKFISTMLELVVSKEIISLIDKHNIKLITNNVQNKYPDFSIVLSDGNYVALDVKSSYRINQSKISGFTLGSYKGYLRNPASTQYSMFPYNKYVKHYCICIIYSRPLDNDDFALKDIDIFIQEKYCIASDVAGSGNTSNIGSIKDISMLKSGDGVFKKLGENVFEEYWRNYGEYKNLKGYLEYMK